MQNAHLFQLLYYMYYLKKNYGVDSSHGVLHYPLLNQNVDVFLTDERVKQIEEALKGIVEIKLSLKAARGNVEEVLHELRLRRPVLGLAQH